MDPVQKRRMQNRLAQRNHRTDVGLKKRGGQINKNNKSEETGGKHQDHEKASSIKRTAQEQGDFGGTSGEIPTGRRESLPGFQNRAKYNNTYHLYGDAFLMQEQSSTVFSTDCEMNLDSVLDKELSSYRYNVLSGENFLNGLRGDETSAHQDPILRFDADAMELEWLSQPDSTIDNPMNSTEHPHNQKENKHRAHYHDRTSSMKSCCCGSSAALENPPLQDLVDVSSRSSQYQYILSCVQRAGFENFDSMVSDYYTCQFEKNSVADRAQKTSRGKHLCSVLSNLHEHSREWTTSESRGFRDQIIKAAEGIYDEEFTRFAQRREKKTPRKQSDPAFSRDQKSLESSGSSAHEDGDEDHSRLLSGGIPNSGTLGELHRLYPNKLPNVWALLTELAGASGAQAEAATLMATSLLHHTRMDPKVDIRSLMLRLLDSLDESPDM
ncbi:uncharacterized protein BP5553_06528 [Venustampulla echinocandica]|uniref:BZIP domain-containing protein n=1 Tax=Venustampulla echinocandica TaxID=2656787 RepID=A0A370TK65_9HELO|nr:uncharacterized protein BP5553_06528 [Venustampulla echinocandica]RDL35916.1 hypothetical protein BP5553_06528 [Venustampulla echinocandica]